MKPTAPRAKWTPEPTDDAKPAATLKVLVVDQFQGGTGGLNSDYIRIHDETGSQYKVTDISYDHVDKQWHRPGGSDDEGQTPITSPTFAPVLTTDRPDVVIFNVPDLSRERDCSPETQDPMMAAIIATSKQNPPPHVIIHEWAPVMLIGSEGKSRMEHNLAALAASGAKVELIDKMSQDDVYARVSEIAGERSVSAVIS